MNYTLMSGAGNLFAVFDQFDAGVPDQPADLARSICEPRAHGGVVPRPDGILFLLRPIADGDCRMEIYNADGSRAETCGNGLRCIAKLAFDSGRVKREHFVIESDAGLCAAEVMLERGAVVSARVHMGTPRIIAAEEEIRVDARDSHVVHATLVDIGNPHCVLFVDDERTAPVATLGPELERHARFPRGTNVEFLALRREGNFLRVWERGVGETQACGSGACAAAAAAVARGSTHWPVQLNVPGGWLRVESDSRGGVFLVGPVESLRTNIWTRSSAVRSS
jgi:diaminopimelate epimerase